MPRTARALVVAVAMVLSVADRAASFSMHPVDHPEHRGHGGSPPINAGPDNPLFPPAASSDRHPSPSRRAILRSVLPALAVVALPPTAARAGIDVSGLKVQANPTDVFLGGTYYEDTGREETLDGRISRRKYRIVEGSSGSGTSVLANAPKPAKDLFQALGDRPVTILGESTSISSSRDDPIELSGVLSPCPEDPGRGCIVIDFTPLGGARETQGYWDEREGGIRFRDSPVVWSKQ